MAEPITPTKPLENIAQTLARELPRPIVVLSQDCTLGGSRAHVAVPNNMKLVEVDNENLLAAPRRIVSKAELADSASFVDYVNFFADGSAAVWCDFNPDTFKLKFTAVFDDHGPAEPGWRSHQANFTPSLSAEWKVWTAHDGKRMSQIAFAEFLEAHERDIAGGPKHPSSLDMMTMATAFEANADKRFKSKVRLQSGGVQLEYVNMDDQQTVDRMRLFERFQIGLPVFWEATRPGPEPVKAWPVEARLKYAVAAGEVQFWYALMRPDIVHGLAAAALIEAISQEIGEVPLRMGSCA
jgi:uncharacterized protein YfdQ (DUF2303 family)